MKKKRKTVIHETIIRCLAVYKMLLYVDQIYSSYKSTIDHLLLKHIP